jgi:3-hydroxyisobutyrate dehydrogenase
LRIAVIGAGLMGSNLTRCLVSRGVEVIVYNRTRSKAERLCRETGCSVVEAPRKIRDADAAVVFVFDDKAVLNVLLGDEGLAYSSGKTLVLNSSTIMPVTSTYVSRKLGEKGFRYYESPVYGSTSEARECRLVSLLGGDPEEWGEAARITSLYSERTVYVGEVPKAMALKLALNNIGLSLPPIIGESLEILEAYDVPVDKFLEASSRLWFGGLIERYLGRIAGKKGEVRFTVNGAAKDYRVIASSLSEKNYPPLVSSALMNYYMMASRLLSGEDYPRAAAQFLRNKEKLNLLSHP